MSVTNEVNLERYCYQPSNKLSNSLQMKFVEAILSNNSTDDHCREFVTQKGLQPLMSILGLPNLPIDFPTSPACQAVSIVCKSILVSICPRFQHCCHYNFILFFYDISNYNNRFSVQQSRHPYDTKMCI